MPRRIGLPLVAWPTADRTAWERATTGDDFFAADAAAARWRSASRRQAFYAYSRWLGFAGEQWPGDLELDPATRISRERVQIYVEALIHRRLTPMSIAAELQHLLLAFRALAPRENWSWLGKLQYGWQKHARPRDLRHKMIDPRRLFDLGFGLMATADEPAAPLNRARQFRDGLLIALLIAVPMRRRSLAALEIERNLRRIGEHYLVVLNQEDTKAGYAVEFDVPARLEWHVTRYLEHYRPMFPRADRQSALWLSTKGCGLCAEAIHDLVCRRTKRAFGFTVHPHLFRAIAATTIAREVPESIAIARDLLAHAKLDTTVHYYTQAQTVRAARNHSALLERLRGGDTAPAVSETRSACR